MDLKKINKEVSQAVVYIDSDESFYPLTLSQPKVLMNLVNRPILEYNLDMLLSSNIQETFIFCNDHFQKIKQFIDNFKEKRNIIDTMNIQIFFSEDYTNLGCVLRDLDSKCLIKGNFILMYGDCIGNIRLDQLIEKHKQNIKQDPGCVMTCIFRKLSPNHRSRLYSKENPFLLLDSNKKIIFFEKQFKKTVQIPTDLLIGNSISIHYDLFDTQISICSEKVPPDFSDNFDFETRENFIHGLLADIELLQHHIHVHILEEGYAARVENILAYNNISCDVLQRFLYPIVPDIVEEDEKCFSYRRNNVYLQDKVHISNKPKILKNVAIGRGTSIGFETSIIDSVVEENCTIGDNVIINKSYIFANTKIESNSTIEKCLIDSNVIIGENSMVKQCSVSRNVIIDKGKIIENIRKLYFDPDVESDPKIVGPEGRGCEYRLDQDFSDNDDESGKSDDHNDDDYDSESTKFESDSDDDDDVQSLGDEFSSFYNEVYDSLSRGIEENSLAENIILEINSSKHAYNVPVKEVNSLVVKALLNLGLNERDNGNNKNSNYFIGLKPILKYAIPIFKNYIKSEQSQNDCLYAIEEFHLNNSNNQGIRNVSSLHLIKIIEFLYQENIIEEDLILKWYQQPKILPDHDQKEQQILRQSKEVKLFIKWLLEAEEESSSSGADNDDDDDDDKD